MGAMLRWVRDWLRVDSVLGPRPVGVGRQEARLALLSTVAGFVPPFFFLLMVLYAGVCVGHLALQSGATRWWMVGASLLSFAFFLAGTMWARSRRLRPVHVGWIVLAGSLVVFGQALLHVHLSHRSALLALPVVVLVVAPILQPSTALVLAFDAVAAVLWSLLVHGTWIQVPRSYHAIWISIMLLLGLALHVGFQSVMLRLHAHRLADRGRTMELETTLSAMRTLRDKYELLAQNVSDVLWIRDLELRPVYISPSVARLRGFSAPEVMTQPPEEIFDGGSLARARAWLSQEIHRDEDPGVDPDRSRVVELRVPHKDGSLVWTEARVRFLRDEAGRPTGIVGVSRDIRERKEAEQRLRKAMGELRRSNQELEQFAYVASHDLKEPLRVVASQLRMLERRAAEGLSERGRKYLGHAVQGAERMQEMIDGLLAYSRYGAGEVSYAPVPLDGVLDEVLSHLAVAVEEAGARVVPSGRLPTVWGDRRKLTHLCQNLISNALKFRSKESPRVEVGVEPGAELASEGRVTLVVRDNGIGIAPEYHERVLRIFERLHSHEEIPGAGIGLALCKRIVEQHGGTLSLESAEGQGTAVRFDLPVEAPESASGETS